MQNRSGISPVHIACSKGYEDILKLLLTHAAKQQTLRPSLNSTSAKVQPYSCVANDSCSALQKSKDGFKPAGVISVAIYKTMCT